MDTSFKYPHITCDYRDSYLSFNKLIVSTIRGPVDKKKRIWWCMSISCH